MRLAPLILALSLGVSTAWAGSPVSTFPENPALTTGTMERFKQLLVDPAVFVPGLAPVASLATPAEATSWDLVIDNPRTGIATVNVNNVPIGQVPPLTCAVIHGVRPGQYDVVLNYLNEFSTQARLSSQPVR